MFKKSIKYLFYFFLFILGTSAFSPFVYESFVRLIADSTMLRSEISDDKVYRVDIFYTNSLPLRILAGGIFQDDASLYHYKFIRLYDNKTGKFIAESNICSSREFAISFEKTRFWLGDISEMQGKGLFGYTTDCIVEIK
jgi:hypothetical protein